MALTIDELQIEIQANSNTADVALNKLATSLNNIRTASKGGVGLTAVSNQLKRLNTAIGGMQNPSAKILQLVSALKPLESISKTNLNSNINALKKLPEITKQLSAMNMGSFATQINKVVSALRPLGTEMNKIAVGFNAFPSKIQRVITQTDRLTKSNNNAAKSYGVMGTGIDSGIAKFGIYYMALRQVSNVISGWVTESNAYVENLNLFTVAMGKYADEAIAYARRVQDEMGIDMSEWIRNQGIFMQIATGFGVIEEKAYQMSKGLTQVSYDISSFFNIPIADALTKVQSGISGELEPLRRLGYALDVGTLQQIAYAHGIDQSILKMTQAQKSQIRYIAIMEQSNNVVGDMGRTLITPANALRILNQQLVQLRRALGDMIIPVLIKVIPYVQAFVRVITDAARVIAKLFGFKLPEIDYSTLGGLKTGADDAASSLGDATGEMDKATKAAEKLKNATLGFDELNVISPNTDSAAYKKGAGGVGGDDLGLELPGYDNFIGNLKNKAKELEEPMKRLLKTIAAIGVAFASWKIASSIYNLFTKGLGGAILPKMAAWIWDITRALYGMATGSAAAGSAFAFLTGGTAGLIIAGIAATLAVMVLRFADLWMHNENFKNGLIAIGQWFGSIGEWITNTALPAIGTFVQNLIPTQAIEAFKILFGDLITLFDALDLDFKDLLITLGGIGLLFTPAAPFGVALLGFEALTLAVRGIGYAASDSLTGVDLLGDGISKATKEKMEPFLESFKNLEVTLDSIQWGKKIIKDSDVQIVKTQLKTITDSILSELSSDRNKALQTLDPLKEALGEEKFAQIQASLNESYDNQIKSVQDGEAAILQILQTAADEGRATTEQENTEISKIRASMKETGIKYLSEYEVDSKLILEKMKNNSDRITAEQAAEVVKQAKAAKEGAIKEAEEQYDGIVREALRMREAKTISETEYQAIVAAAKLTKDETIATTEEQYNNIVDTAKAKMGEYADNMDWQTGEIKSNWQVFLDDTVNTWRISITNWWINDVQPWFTLERWQLLFQTIRDSLMNKWNETVGAWNTALSTWWNNSVLPWFTLAKWLNAVVGIKDAIVQTFKNAIESARTLFNKFIDWINSKMKFTWKPIRINGITVVPGGSVQLFTIPPIPRLFAEGGFPDVGELFIAREAGAEMVGAIGNRTAVANNDQIVESISQGVYEAMVNATPERDERPLEVRVYLDGKDITRSVEKVQRERGKSILTGGVVYG